MAVSVGWGVAAAALRTRAWSSSLQLWTDAVAKSPDSAAAHAGLCFALYDAGRIPESLGACAQALAIEPARVDARINYATVLLAVGRAREARSELDRVLAIRPN
jgi:thioredoxin-like negative regulator of GroEL